MTRIGTLPGALRNVGMALGLAALLFASSGCALLLLGAGGAGGYLIRKGEEGESQKKKSEVGADKGYANHRSDGKVLT